MRILMLGNSLTTANNMPRMLVSLTGAEVTVHARGGARLAEQLNPRTQLGARTQAALCSECWDYVVLQEMSHGPCLLYTSSHSPALENHFILSGSGAFPSDRPNNPNSRFAALLCAGIPKVCAGDQPTVAAARDIDRIVPTLESAPQIWHYILRLSNCHAGTALSVAQPVLPDVS